MKKYISCIILIFTTLSVYAQNTLKGAWTQDHSMMGISVVEVMTFSDENEGEVTESMKITFSMSMPGAKVEGEGVGILAGTFKYDGTSLVIKWNPDSFGFEVPKPIKATHKGETVEINDSDFTGIFDQLSAEMQKEGSKETVFQEVKIDNKKLTLQFTNKEGKIETSKYTRVQ